MPPTRAARWTTRSGRAVGERGRSAASRSVRSNSALRGTTTSAPRSASLATTTRPRKPDPPVTRTRRRGQNEVMRTTLPASPSPTLFATSRCHRRRWAVRVAFTLEQCWHRVPGGTAVAALELARALARRDEVVAGRRRRPPPAAHRRRRSSPPIAVRQLPLPRPALYEAWLRLRRPPVAARDRTGRRGPRHDDHRPAPLGAARRHGPRPRLPARAGAVHRARGAGLQRRARPDGATPTSCCARRRPRSTTASGAGIGTERLRLVPLGVRPRGAASAGGRRGGPPPARCGRPYVLFVGTLEPRKNLRRLVEAVGAAAAGPRPRGGRPAGLGRRRSPPRSARVRLAGLRRRAHELRALYAGADVVRATRACGRASACRCSRRWPTAHPS